MGNKKDLNAYVRYDGTGRVISGSLILQRKKPLVGNWKQINAYECCSPTCLPPVYGQDYIIDGIVEGEAGVTFQILTNPFTGVILEVCIVDCSSDINRILPLQIELVPPASNPYNYFVPDDILNQGCAIAFRRVCNPGYSGWDVSFGG